MFYSHTFLARKGPLGTVWCAAHLQHRLKKYHYTSTDIPTTVDRIMFPEVPIALRLSGHLLLGVVRVYSKKVDYFCQDCRVLLRDLINYYPSASTEVTLPEEASQAPFQSVTLPETFVLEAFDLDDGDCFIGAPDNNLRSQDEITLTDQIPVGGDSDPYIAISVDEDIIMGSSKQVEFIDSWVRPMEEDPISRPPVNGNVGFQEPGPSTQDIQGTEIPPGSSARFHGSSNLTELLNATQNDENSLQDIPEIEILRDAEVDVGCHLDIPSSVSPARRNDVAEPHRPFDETMNLEDVLYPLMEDNLDLGKLPFQHSAPSTSVSQEPPGMIDMHVSFGKSPPELAVRPSTPVQKQPKPRARKRKQLFDEAIVLPNKVMKKALENSSSLLRKRSNIPCSALSTWKLNNGTKKEQVFLQPTVTGMCSDLCNTFNKEYIITKPHLISSEEASDPRFVRSPGHEEAFPDLGVVQSPAPTATAASTQVFGVQKSPAPPDVPDYDTEIEHLRDVEGNEGSNILPHLLASPSRLNPSPRKDGLSPVSTQSLRSPSLISVGAATGTAVSPTSDLRSSPHRHSESEYETPWTFLEERLHADNTGLSDIPELMNSTEAEELNFLEADNNSAIGSQGTDGFDSLPVRTRAVAKYLKGHSPITPISEDSSSDLSLKKILNGKTRKQCARMFFETLVLKSYGLIDVQQEVPYGDIYLRPTPTLSKSQI